jgi:DNA helicase HerA-like ATPase
MNSIGFVLGNKPASPLEFWIGLEETEETPIIELDDIVKVETFIGRKKITYYGIITELYRYLEGSGFSFDAKDFREGKLPSHVAFIGKVKVLRMFPEHYIPPFPGDKVYLVQDIKDIELALYFDQMEIKIPAGLIKNKTPVYINYSFLNGKDGAHISISGVSGVASKTSYALFLLHSLFSTVKKEKIYGIIFNVKGEDLFFLDKKNKLFEKRREEYEKLYKLLGLPAQPFKDVNFFAPPKSENNLVPDVETRQEKIKVYLWTLREFAEEGLIKFMFIEGEEGVGSIHYVIDKMAERLKELADYSKNLEKNDASKKDRLYFTEHDLFNEEGQWLPPVEIENLYSLLKFLKELVKNRKKCNADKKFRTDHEEFCNKVAFVFENWFGTVTVNVAYAFLRRFEQAIQHTAHMIVSPDMLEKEKEEYKINWEKAKLTVIGINKLHSIAQTFVVGSILKKLFKEKEKKGRLPVIFVVLDELNKYAPREGWSPIKDILLDIAERGRSLGIILIGAQQTASQIERRILANSSIKVNGRMDASEITAKEYDYLLPEYKQRSLILRKGEMILTQPDIPIPLIVSFPFPVWATRSEEAVMEENDDFQLDEFIP